MLLNKLYLGSTAINRAYLGSTLLFPPVWAGAAALTGSGSVTAAATVETPANFDTAYLSSVKAGAVMNNGINYTDSHQLTSVKVGAVLRET